MIENIDLNIYNNNDSDTFTIFVFLQFITKSNGEKTIDLR